MSTTQKLLCGYCSIILLGTLLLSLRISVKEPYDISFMTSFFTATSATCVTGLIVADTWSHWTLFGQLIILGLIQIGGLGFMTLYISAVTLTNRKIDVNSRVLMQNSISAPKLGGVVHMARFALVGTAIVEAIGAFLLSLYFIPKYGVIKGIWRSVFHSISAFCNAGFDIMGFEEAGSSLTKMEGNWYIIMIIMLLIIIGGLGFFVWDDILKSKFKFSEMSLQSRVVLSVSGILIFGGAVVLFLLEHSGEAMKGMNLSEKVAGALFQSVTARTAGFNTLDVAKISGAGKFVMICLMLIGGSPGSTAGGMKTTTFAIMMMSIPTAFAHRKTVEVFRRRMEDTIIRSCTCIVSLYLVLTAVVSVIISAIEKMDFIDVLFECASAIGTVGITAGITSSLGNVSLILLTFLMIFGRAGSLTMLLAFSSDRKVAISKYPLEDIQVG